MEAKITESKKAKVEALNKDFTGVDGFIFSDFRGLSVEQLTKIRKELMGIGASLKVVKNRYAKIALKEVGTEITNEEDLKGPTAIALVKGDKANEVAKILFAAADETEKLKVKGAIVDGKYFTQDEIKALSKLPSKLELISMLMGTLRAPVQKLAATLLAVQKQKESGSAPAEQG